MDLNAIAEWSRYVIGVALIAYLASWLAFNSEMGLRARIRLQRTARVQALESEPALVGADEPGRAPKGGGPGEDPTGFLAEQADAKSRQGYLAFLLGTVILAVGVAMRGIGTERMPWGNMHEFSITAALVASIVFLVLSRRSDSETGRAIGPWVTLLVFITLGLAVTVLYVPPGPLVPALRSYWLVAHVGLAVIAFGLFTVAAVVNVLQILSERAAKRGSTSGLAAALPESSRLDRLGYRLTAVAFPIWTVGPLILGAIWAEVSWGRYWGWDPKEVWALITWLAYAAYLHARATAGWKGAKASVVGLLGYATALFSYFGVNIFFEGLHSYGGL